QRLVAAQAVDRRGVDDRTAIRQVPQGRPGGQEVADDVDPERALELFRGQFGEITDRVLGGDVVDEHVKPAEFVHRAVDHGLAVLLLGQVRPDRRALLPGRPDQFGGVRRVLVLYLRQVADRDVRAFLGERDRYGPADARVAPGHQR